jgi:hypothetical protein
MKKIVVFVAALALFASTAYAAEWNFYGSARVATFYTDAETIGAAGTDTKSLAEGLQGNSRIGATVKVSDELTGGFEYGAGVNVRKLYGEWNFGAGSFLVGQTYTPLNWFYSNQVYGSDNDLLAQGGIYSGRAPMLRLTFGDFQIAAVSPNANTLGTGLTAEVDIPAIEAKYTMNFDALTLQMAGGYNSYELIGAGVTYDVDSYVAALGAKLDLGAFFLNGNIYAGENVGHLMAVSVDGDNAWGDGLAAISGTQVLDNEALGYLLVAGFKANDMFTFEAGYGHVETELDGAAVEDECASYYVNATVTMAPGVFFVPEIGMIDGEEAGDTETLYYGVKWQINF